MKSFATLALGVALLGCASPHAPMPERLHRPPLEEGVAAFDRGDYQTAFHFFERSASAGNVEGQIRLARLYDRGDGVPQNYSEAVKWFRLAAEQGSAEGQSNLGAFYSSGRGVPQNYLEAVKWYRLAAEQGNASAQFNLASMYLLGRGVPKDYVQALKWFNVSASRSADATTRLMALSSVTDVASMMTPAQIREAHELAVQWKPTKR